MIKMEGKNKSINSIKINFNRFFSLNLLLRIFQSQFIYWDQDKGSKIGKNVSDFAYCLKKLCINLEVSDCHNFLHKMEKFDGNSWDWRL